VVQGTNPAHQKGRKRKLKKDDVRDRQTGGQGALGEVGVWEKGKALKKELKKRTRRGGKRLQHIGWVVYKNRAKKNRGGSRPNGGE